MRQLITIVALLWLVSTPAQVMLSHRRAAIKASSVSPVNDGLLAYWKLEEPDHSNRLDSFDSRTLVEGNAATISNTTGKIGMAAQGYSTAGSLTNADAAYWDALTNAFTIVFWMKPGNLGTAGQLVGKDDATSQREFTLQAVGANSIHLYVWDDNPNYKNPILNGVLTNSAQWFFVAAKWSRASSNAYLSVNLVSNVVTGVERMNKKTATLSLLALPNGGVDFGGPIDEVGIWARELSIAELVELYNNGNGKTCCPFQ